MSESQNVSDILARVWKDIEESENSISVRVSPGHVINITEALKDIYEDTFTNIESCRNGLTALAAILIAAQSGTADKLIEEMLVEEWRGLLDDREFFKFISDFQPESGSREDNPGTEQDTSQET